MIELSEKELERGLRLVQAGDSVSRREFMRRLGGSAAGVLMRGALGVVWCERWCRIERNDGPEENEIEIYIGDYSFMKCRSARRTALRQ